MNPPVSVRPATPDDLSAILDVVQVFIAETTYDVAYEPTVAWDFLWRTIAAPTSDILVAEMAGENEESEITGGEIIGGAIVFASHEFQVRPFCYVGKFFVAPAGRRTPAARLVLDAIAAWARDQGCSHVFSTATAGLDVREQRLFVNLMKRAGYGDAGPVLCRTL